MVPPIRKAADRLISNIRTFGVGNAVHDAAICVVNRFAYLRILQCVAITTTPRIEACAYAHGFLDRERLLAWMRDPEYDMTPEFVEEALGKGDRCYGIWD